MGLSEHPGWFGSLMLMSGQEQLRDTWINAVGWKPLSFWANCALSRNPVPCLSRTLFGPHRCPKCFLSLSLAARSHQDQFHDKKHRKLQLQSLCWSFILYLSDWNSFDIPLRPDQTSTWSCLWFTLRPTFKTLSWVRAKPKLFNGGGFRATRGTFWTLIKP